VEECKEKDMTYSAPIFVRARFMNRNTGEIKEQTVFMGDFPMMTDKGTVHHQRHRARRRVAARAVAGRHLRAGRAVPPPQPVKHQLVKGTIHPYRGSGSSSTSSRSRARTSPPAPASPASAA
jgi:DNA-directed RNA polymerase subunit beta